VTQFNTLGLVRLCGSAAVGYALGSGGCLMNRVERYLIPLLVGFAPALFALMTWSPHGPTQAREIILATAPSVLVAELFTIVIALREGIVASWRELRPPTVALVALGLWIAVALGAAAFVAPSRDESLARTAIWMLHFAFGFSVAFLAGRMFRPMDMVWGWFAGFVGFALVFITFVLTIWGRPFDWTGGLPAAQHIRHLGYYWAAIAAMAFGVMAIAGDRRRYGAAFGVAFLALALSLWTGSRGPIVAVAGAMVVGLAMFPMMRAARAWGGAGLSMILAIAMVALLPAPANNMGLARTVIATTQHEVSTGRVSIWKQTVHAIEARPVFGWGEGQFRWVAPFYSMQQPHELVVQILLAWGAVGLLLLIVCGFYFARRAIPVARADESALAAPFLGMTAIFLFALYDGALYHLLPVSIFAGCAGLIASRWVSKDPPLP
jgi:O-antigen ligase